MDYSEYYQQIIEILVDGLMQAVEPIIEVIQQTLVVVLPLVGIYASIRIGLKLFKLFSGDQTEAEQEVLETFDGEIDGTLWVDDGTGIYRNMDVSFIDEYDLYYEIGDLV